MADLHTNIPQLSFGQSDKETTVNELFDAASPAMIFGRNGVTSAGLRFGLLGGRLNGLPFANAVIDLPDDASTYLSIDLATGVFSSESGGFKAGETPLYKLTTSGGLVTNYEDHRQMLGGGAAGPLVMADITDNQGKVLDNPFVLPLVTGTEVDEAVAPGGYLLLADGYLEYAKLTVSVAPDGTVVQVLDAPILGKSAFRIKPPGGAWGELSFTIAPFDVQNWYSTETVEAPNAVINGDGSFSRSVAKVVTGPASSVDGQMVVFDGVSGKVVKGVAALSTTGNNATIPMSQLATSSALNGKINKPASAVAGALTMFADGTGSNVLSSTSVGSSRYFIPNIDVRNEYPVPYDGILPNSGSRTEFKNLNLSIPGTANPVAKDAPGLVSAVPTPLGNYANITTLSPWNDPSGGMPTQLCYADNGLFIRRGSAGWSLASSPTNSSWTASTVTSLNAILHATAQNRTYFFFKCTTAGTTGTTEPVWPTTDGGTVVDGTVVWTAYAYWSPWKVIPTANYASLTDLPANAYIDSAGNISRSNAVTGRRVAVPASSSSTGVLGDWSSDENYLYVCHATNTWRRTAVSTF